MAILQMVGLGVKTVVLGCEDEEKVPMTKEGPGEGELVLLQVAGEARTGTTPCPLQNPIPYPKNRQITVDD